MGRNDSRPARLTPVPRYLVDNGNKPPKLYPSFNDTRVLCHEKRAMVDMGRKGEHRYEPVSTDHSPIRCLSSSIM